MESQVVRRRMRMIAGHFAPNDDISATATATATHIFPLNCSSSLNSAIRRCDNRMYYARQGSSSQACYMRQVSTDQVPNDDISATATHVFPLNSSSNLNSIIRRCDNRMYYARQGSSSQACYMRQVSTDQGSSAQSGMPLKCTGAANDGSSNTFEAPSFSRPTSIEPSFANVEVVNPVVQDCKSLVPEPPKFATPNRRISGLKQFHSKNSFASNGFEWSPRMDVAESGRNFVVTVELPGVGVNDVRVEVNERTLTVTGKRSTQWWKVETCSNDSVSAYHKREILQGPYQVVWPLPPNVNKDSVSAEFVDGFLRITIPQL